MADRFQLQQLPWAVHSGSLLQAALDDGWEPFAVTETAHPTPTIWLKRIEAVSNSLTSAPHPP